MTEILYIGLLLLCIVIGFSLGRLIFPKKQLLGKISKLSPPPPPCKPQEHEFIPNGYDNFSDYFKCRKCGAEKREHFIKE